MKKICLLSCLLGLIALSSCREEIEEPLLFDEPGIDFVKVEREGVRGAVISCQMRPTRKMYDNHFGCYECGMEYSTDSLFRRSVTVSFGHPDSKDYVIHARLSNLFPDSVYYFKPILVKVDHLLAIRSYITENGGNRYLADTDEIICSGNVVTVRETPFDVDDYAAVWREMGLSA